MAELSYTVAHDLRSPIRHINSFATLVLRTDESKLSQQEKEYLNHIKNISVEVGQKVDALLNYTKMEQQELEPTKVEVDSMVANLIAQYSIDSSVQIDWQIKSLPHCYADNAMLKVVFQHLSLIHI